MSLTIRGMKERIIDKQSGITLRHRNIERRRTEIQRTRAAIMALSVTQDRLERKLFRLSIQDNVKSAELRVAEANKATLESALQVFLREDV